LNPYRDLPGRSFWKPAVGEREPLAISDIWTPKFGFDKSHRIATFGSCFAQHFSRALTRLGYSWFDGEPAPDMFSEDVCRRYGYRLFSARTGNIYTAQCFRQWIDWALEPETAPDEVWVGDGRCIDPLRPTIQPDGFADEERMRRGRRITLAALRRVIETSDRLVFTLGLTEAWRNRETGVVYPLCPGVAGGDYDPDSHEFHNYTHSEILSELNGAIATLRGINPSLGILLTVSPVPLTATATGGHVLVATTYSKSVLRAVAGEIAADLPFVDYFPSYELVTSPLYRGPFYNANARTISADGVDFVMSSFFASQDGSEDTSSRSEAEPHNGGKTHRDEDLAEDEICDDVMLDAFR